MLGLIPFDFNLRGDRARGVWLVNWRALPIGSQMVGLDLLGTVQKAGFAAVLALGLSDVAKKIYSGLKFQILPQVPRWVRVFDARRMADLLELTHEGNGRSELRGLHPAYAAKPRSSASSDATLEVLCPRNPFDRDWDAFWIGYLAPRMIGPARDSRYMNWRYVEHPSFAYQFRLARDRRNGKILGLAVFRIEVVRQRDDAVLRLVEYLCAPDAAGTLAQSVVDAARDHRVVLADFYCTDTRMSGYLTRCGFRRAVVERGNLGLPSRFQPIDGRPSIMRGAVWTPQSWANMLGNVARLPDFHITKADSDQDRPT